MHSRTVENLGKTVQRKKTVGTRTSKKSIEMAMDMHLLVMITTALLIGVFTFLTIILFRRSSVADRRKNLNTKVLPKVPGAWPVIGHLHLLNSPQPPHLILARMADKYGPIFTLKFGLNQTLLVSDGNTAKECLTTNDKVFATRPKTLAADLLGYNHAVFGLGPYGPYWRQSRKIVMLQLLSNRRIEMLGHVRESELKASLKDIYLSCLNSRNSSDMVPKEMKKWFGNMALNTIVRILFGMRYASDDEEGIKTFKTLRELMDLLGTFIVSDAVPFLRWLDLGGYAKSMKKTAKELDNMLQNWLEEHKSKRNKMDLKREEQDFMDIMISILDGASSEDLHNFSADTIIKGICLALLSGATDTTTVTLTWALALLLNNPQELKKVMAELDEHVGRHRRVQESDIENLVYLQAIIKETLRLYPAAPLAIPHESLEDCIVGGYRVPKGTQLILNLHKIQRDPNVWSAPDKFQPERFLTSHQDIDVRGQHFELIPFGSGRRICPGLSFGLNVVHFSLASLLHAFEFAKPSDEPVDMTEGFGLTNLKATPLEVLVAPRLSADLYK